MSFKFGANSVSNHDRLADAGFRENNHKFVAAVTNHAVGVAYRRQDYGSHFHQNMRAGEGAMLLVDGFEIVEVKEQRRFLRAKASRPLHFVHEKLTKIARIVQTRQFVRNRKSFSFGNAKRV